jgi:hypothetical protein
MEFTDAINAHLDLRRRNAQLEPTLPLERYRTDLRARNDRPLNGQTQAASEKMEAGSAAASGEAETNRDTDSSRLWDVPPVFDWGE